MPRQPVRQTYAVYAQYHPGHWHMIETYKSIAMAQRKAIEESARCLCRCLVIAGSEWRVWKNGVQIQPREQPR